jgi:hypothetical protein
MDQNEKHALLAAVQRLPEWIRHDLGAKDSTMRIRAEEALAAMLGNALDQLPIQKA